MGEWENKNKDFGDRQAHRHAYEDQREYGTTIKSCSKRRAGHKSLDQ